MSMKRMSDTTKSVPDISRLTDKELKEAGWEYHDEDSGRCIECLAPVERTTYWNGEVFATIRSGCKH